MSTSEPSVPEALSIQARACAQLGSPQYAALIEDLRADYEAQGLTFELLSQRPEPALRDALVLRYLAAVHRIVLRGDAPALAASYPSAGGEHRPIDVKTFLDVVAAHRHEVIDGLGRNVQTNEVGRCAALIVGFSHVARRAGLGLNMLELGGSAGLISNWDRYWYRTPPSNVGDPTSEVRLVDRWLDPFDLTGLTPVVSRRACDIAPIDASDSQNQQRLLSFVWPDQTERFTLLRAALELAQRHRPVVDAADAGQWLEHQLDQRQPGTATIVFHSIVWQYLPRATKDHVRTCLAHHGASTGRERPLAWVRMEPAGPLADVRVTMWPGGEDEVVALTSYHGADVRQPG